ncbi:MAG: FHA domain-containing protein, partial [Gammaproteobacteria bacterium]|nr:FHA domain-containing protein [Gammaproteobacteria bacterium]
MGPMAVREFEESGGVVGRASGSDWVLPDSQKYISSTHFQVACNNGSWFLTDTSTNGTYLNDPNGRPIGRGAPVMLNEGDRIYLGEYEIAVSFAQDHSVPSQGDFSQPAYTGPQTPPSNPLPNDPFGSTATPDQLAPAVDPLKAFDTPTPTPAPATGPVQMEDPGSALDEHFAPPGQKRTVPGDDWDKTGYEAPPAPAQPAAGTGSWPAPDSGAIPDNWDKTSFETPAGPETPATAAPDPMAPDPLAAPTPAPQAGQDLPENWDRTNFDQPAAPPPQAAPPQQPPAQQPPPQQPQPGPGMTTPPPAFQPGAGGDASAALGTLLAGAGIDPTRVPPEAADHIMYAAGQIFREVVHGMMDVLRARAELKSEFRIALTTVQAVHNNPLKFSPNLETAMESVLLKRGDTDLEPVDAVRE